MENIIKLKVVLIGDVNVGKTSLAVRFTRDKFDQHLKHTIGASFITKVAIVHGDVISFQIWDTAGQERYKSLVPMYLRGAHIAFIVYDVTDQTSFRNVDFWLDALQHHGDMATAVLVANKCDLESAVDETMAVNYAMERGIQFVTTSAKTGYNVEQLFHSIGCKVVNSMKKLTAPQGREREQNRTEREIHNRRITSSTETTDNITIDPEPVEDRKKSRCCKK